MKIKLKNPHKEHQKLLCNAHKNVICLEAKINYTTFTFQTGKTIMMSYNLAMYDMLLPRTFIRVNRSCIINKSFIENLNPLNKKITMKNGTEFQISRRRWNEISEDVA